MGNFNRWSFSTWLKVGDMANRRHELKKINVLHGTEYFKVDDLLDNNKKKCLEFVDPNDNGIRNIRMTRLLFKLISDMNHPNIIACDRFTEHDDYFLVRNYNDTCYGFWYRLQIMKLLNHRKKYYPNKLFVEEYVVLYWLKQLLTAVSALHQNKVLHKFICPEIISFHYDKIRVFVPARSEILKNYDEHVDVKKTWYNCPEHSITGAIGLKYDMWSLGWTLYTICTLDDPREWLESIEDFNDYTRPDLPRQYSRDLDRIFKSLVNAEPEDRPRATDLLDDPIFDSQCEEEWHWCRDTSEHIPHPYHNI